MSARGKSERRRGLRLLEFHRPPFDLNRVSVPQLTPESRRYVRFFKESASAL